MLLLSTRDEVLPIVEELVFTVTGRDGAPMRLSIENARRQMKEFLDRPDLVARVRRILAEQAGDGRPVVLPWEEADVGDRPQSQVCTGLDTWSVPGRKKILFLSTFG